MLQYIYILLLFIAILNENEIVNTGKFVNAKYISSLSNVDNKMKDFCKELSLIDKPSENTLLMRNFKDSLINRNNMTIKSLNKEIDSYYVNKINTEVSLKHKYRLNQHKTAKKQLEAINLAKNNLINKNSIQLNVK